jgi:hypothetical protein
MEYLKIIIFEFDQELMNVMEIQQMLFHRQEQLVIDNTTIYHHLLTKFDIISMTKTLSVRDFNPNQLSGLYHP